MSPFSRRFLPPFLLLMLFALATPWLGAQNAADKKDEKKDAADPTAIEKVHFTTVDGVKLSGTFYRGPKAAPVVLLLHAVGGDDNSNKSGWVELAKTLQTDFSVFTFDFRGHGKSVEIDPLQFRKYAPNIKAFKSLTADKTTIDIKGMEKFYYPLLCNDIAAAKSYLERTKNDLGLCNVQNFLVIGAEQGATLGAIWANSEWYRYKMDLVPPLYQPRFAGTPEGKWFTGFVWLSISPKAGTRDVNVASTSDLTVRVHTVPTMFLYGENDTLAKKTAQSVDKWIILKSNKKEPDKRLAMTGSFPVPKSDKLAGVELLQPSLGTVKAIKDRLKKVVENASEREWTQRDFLKKETLYVWRGPGTQAVAARPMPANVTGISAGLGTLFPVTATAPTPALPDSVEKNLAYHTYDVFLK
jgi:pimeloyl-ACP methyl ester carboxylesterase